MGEGWNRGCSKEEKQTAIKQAKTPARCHSPLTRMARIKQWRRGCGGTGALTYDHGDVTLHTHDGEESGSSSDVKHRVPTCSSNSNPRSTFERNENIRLHKNACTVFLVKKQRAQMSINQMCEWIHTFSISS